MRCTPWTGRPGPTPGIPRQALSVARLPGAQWKLAVELLQPQPALAPRIFFGIALACLAALLVALQMLWRGSLRRRQAERLAAAPAAARASARLVAVGEVASTLAHEAQPAARGAQQLCQRPAQPRAARQHHAAELIPVLSASSAWPKAGRVIQRVNAFARRRR